MGVRGSCPHSFWLQLALSRTGSYLDGEIGNVGELLHEASNLLPTVSQPPFSRTGLPAHSSSAGAEEGKKEAVCVLTAASPQARDALAMPSCSPEFL